MLQFVTNGFLLGLMLLIVKLVVLLVHNLIDSII